MAGISAKAPGKLENKKEKFQGQPLDDELGLHWYGFKWRNHDPQIGRFIQVDPLSEKYVHNSTYAFSENKVTAHVELEGLESISFQHIVNQLWNSTGISKSYSGKEFAQDLGTAAKNPDNYVQAGQMLGQAAVFLFSRSNDRGFGVWKSDDCWC
jgi:RHS repeat-associated protein